MLGHGWLALRQADEALRSGRLEDAQRLLGEARLQGQRGTAERICRLAHALVERGDEHLARDDADNAWRDVEAAEALQASPRRCGRLRQALVRLGLTEVRGWLRAGEPDRADQAIARLRARRVRSPEIQVLQEVVKDWLAARDLADHGEFTVALVNVNRMLRLQREAPVLVSWKEELERRRDAFPCLLMELHERVEAGRWTEVVAAAERVLAAAPQHVEARKARARAWKAIEPVTMVVPVPDGGRLRSPDEGNPLRFLLWIDGVGGYLVCLGNRVTFGHSVAGDRVDVPLGADVSRLHASLTRDAEGYVLEAVRPIQVNGQNVTRVLLQADDRVTLGATCQFLFRRPAPVSATARLDLVSGHRVTFGVDGVLLMAETLVLGDGVQVHIPIPDLAQPIVFFRHKDGLGLRHTGGLRVNGRPDPERGPLPLPAHVAGEEISFAVEPVD